MRRSIRTTATPSLSLLTRVTTRPIVRAAQAVLVACALALAGCVPPPAVTPQAPVHVLFTPATYATLPGWSGDQVAAAWPAFRVGCKALVARARTQALWQRPCVAAETVDANDAQAVRRFFEQNFTPYRVTSSDGSERGLVTGYYEPLLHGSRSRSAEYPQPLYAPPDDLLIVDLADLYPELEGKRVRGRLDGRRVVPYWPRADIDAGRADTVGKALVYVSDAVDAFFLQIQGSGRVALDDGSVIRVGYADQNGQPFRSVARVLIDRGELTIGQASMQGIREWGREHPGQLPALLDENPSYVFFREVPPPSPGSLEAAIDGPIGSLGVPLLAGRAIAVDPRSIPLGAPVFLATIQPLSDEPRRAAPSGELRPLGGSEAAQAASVGGSIPPRRAAPSGELHPLGGSEAAQAASVGGPIPPLQRLVMAQDTGGAIRGPIRADFFCGFGDDAGREAGRMREQGAMWLLWPTGAPLPDSASVS